MPPLRLLCIVTAVLCSCVRAAEVPPLRINSPQPWQVLQRSAAPTHLSAQDPARLGSADVQIQFTFDDTAKDGLNAEITAEYRILTASPTAPVSDTTTSRLPVEPWQALKTQFHSIQPGAGGQSSISVPAGGWYRLEIRLLRAGRDPLTASVEPIGVGEVFLVAGQSYATNTNDEILQVKDPQRRVSAYDWETGTWRLANDPQPAPDRSDGGSIWPPAGDLLARELNVPIGFANVAVGGTSTRQWMPAEPLSQRLQQIGKNLAPFRAVLWQQGESDVIENTSVADYVSRLRLIRSAAVDAWQFSPPWFCALSTHHPTVYQRPAAENTIREALTTVSRLPGFQLGPDTDSLRADNRGGPRSRRHFSPLGQRNAAKLWADTLLKYLSTQNALAIPRVRQSESSRLPAPSQQ